MKNKVQLCSLSNIEFLEGVIEEIESSVASQCKTIEELRTTIDQLRIERDTWQKAVEDIVETLLNVKLPESYNGLPKEESL